MAAAAALVGVWCFGDSCRRLDLGARAGLDFRSLQLFAGFPRVRSIPRIPSDAAPWLWWASLVTAGTLLSFMEDKPVGLVYE